MSGSDRQSSIANRIMSSQPGTKMAVKKRSASVGRRRKLAGTPEQRALNRQWIEYNLSHLVNNLNYSHNMLRELDYALTPFTFFTGNSMAVADREIYYSLYPTFSTMNFQEKEKYANLCKWFRIIQEDDVVRGDREKISFLRIPLISL